jgi:hypothetical protein
MSFTHECVGVIDRQERRAFEEDHVSEIQHQANVIHKVGTNELRHIPLSKRRTVKHFVKVLPVVSELRHSRHLSFSLSVRTPL